MTIKDCIDIVDKNKPNQYTIKEKVMWISFIEGIIINEVLKTHEGYDGRYDDFEGYSEDKLSVTLIVPSPYDRLYTAYLKMMIDKENGETARYNNSAASYNTYMDEYRRHYNKTHMPINVVGRRSVPPLKQTTTGLSDAEYENIIKDLTYILTEHFSGTVSPDKIYDIVMKYMQNNAEMFKGKPGEEGTPGYSPIKGVDYYTEEEKKEMKSYIDARIIEAATRFIVSVTIKGGASNWTEEEVFDAMGNIVGYRYGQVVMVKNANITEYSKVDLQLSSEQAVIFQNKALAFVAENDNGVITVYCVGAIPENDYTIQATVTEVMLNG